MRRFDALLALVALAAPALSAAQPLPAKRTLPGDTSTPCAPAPASRPPRRDSPEARRFAEIGHEAEIVGDHRAARDAFGQAAALNPGDERLAYYLGRANEELRDAPAAVREYCRYLALAPDADDADDIHARIRRLVPEATSAVPADVREAFRRGVFAYDTRDYAGALDRFATVVRRLPSVPEGYFNRGAAAMALGRRDQAAADLERYLSLRPNAEDAQQVRLQLALLRRPAWSPGTALGYGLVLPGLGQMYTGRPLRGLLVLGVAGGAGVLAAQTRDETRTRSYTDPFGNPYTNTTIETTRPYLAVGIGVGVAIAAAAAYEAYRFAVRSRDVPQPRSGRATATGAPSEGSRLTWSLAPTPRGMAVSFSIAR
jgi:tetratricopeptide (TPR) repeat protein